MLTYIANATAMEGLANLTFTIPNSAGIVPITGDYLGHIIHPIITLNGTLSVNKSDTNSTINVVSVVKVGQSVNITDCS